MSSTRAGRRVADNKHTDAKKKSEKKAVSCETRDPKIPSRLAARAVRQSEACK